MIHRIPPDPDDPAYRPPGLIRPATSSEPIGPDSRKALLAEMIADEVARTGRVEHLMEFQAVLVYGRRVNHILHLLLSVFTAGLWLLIWLLLCLGPGERRRVLSVDELGNVLLR